jgi:hypothetical protein
MTKHDNPPAFPRTGEGVRAGDTHPAYDCPGMTLRDYYFGQALVGIMANPHFYGPLMQQSSSAAVEFANEVADMAINSRAAPKAPDHG